MDEAKSGRKSSKHWGEFQKLILEPTKYCKGQGLKYLVRAIASQLKRFDNYSYIRLKILLIASQLKKGVLLPFYGRNNEVICYFAQKSY